MRIGWRGASLQPLPCRRIGCGLVVHRRNRWFGDWRRRRAAACSLCGKPISFDAAHASRPTIEHVVPRSRGGGNHKNKLVAHSRCNLRKGASMPTGCELLLLDAVNSRKTARIIEGKPVCSACLFPELKGGRVG